MCYGLHLNIQNRHLQDQVKKGDVDISFPMQLISSALETIDISKCILKFNLYSLKKKTTTQIPVHLLCKILFKVEKESQDIKCGFQSNCPLWICSYGVHDWLSQSLCLD